jgi:hypothetical protein
VVLGDGAAWIWKLAEELFSSAIQIVDLFHAKPHLSDVGKAIYGGGTDLTGRAPRNGTTNWTRARPRDVISQI